MIAAAVVSLTMCGRAAVAGFDDEFLEAGSIGQDKVPHLGFSRVLVIPLIIDDVKSPDGLLDRWNSYFENKLDAFTFRNYWNVNSLGRYDVEVTFAKPVHYATCPLPKEFKNCAVPRGDANALEPGIKFLKDVIDRVKKESGINFADFDVNGPKEIADGWVDGLMVMSNADFPGVALPVSLFKKFSVDGVKIGAVAIASLDDKEIIATHEFGHLLGFGDLYHEHKHNRGLYLSLMGEYNDGMPLIDAYSRYKIGWADVIDIKPGTPPEKILLPPAITSGKVARIGNDKEFFLVENRGPGDLFDKKIEKQGLAIYHVDETVFPIPGKWSFIQFVQNCLNCDEWRPLVMNEQPGGKFVIQMGDVKKIGDILFHKGDSFKSDYTNQNEISERNPAFNSNWYSGEPSDVEITDIDDATTLPGVTVKIGYN